MDLLKRMRAELSKSKVRSPVIAISPSAWDRLEYAMDKPEWYADGKPKPFALGVPIVVTGLVEGDDVEILERDPSTNSQFMWEERKSNDDA